MDVEAYSPVFVLLGSSVDTGNETECDWYGVTCNEVGIVEGLELNNNSLAGSIPTQIKLLPSLGESLEKKYCVVNFE
jgi:hypothetical protein